jgi:hypothetical protein
MSRGGDDSGSRRTHKEGVGERVRLSFFPTLLLAFKRRHPGGARAGSKGAGGAGPGLSSLLGADSMAVLLPRLYRQQYDPSPK